MIVAPRRSTRYSDRAGALPSLLNGGEGVFTMQRGADGSAITDGAPLPKTLTLSPNLSGMFSGAREQVSSPAAAPI